MRAKQSKAIGPGRVRTWELDLAAMASCAPWTKRLPGLLEVEVQRVLAAFPTHLATLGQLLPEERCWVEAVEPLRCPACGDLLVFDRGVRCARCERVGTVPAGPLAVGFVGRIPQLITGRPLLNRLTERIQQLSALADPQFPAFRDALLAVNSETYLAPRFGTWFSQSWPHADPPVMVWPEYFAMLGIPPDHVFDAAPFYRLCLYARWREQPIADVMQSRVAPRLLIDLMFADLQAAGKLELALDQLDASLYETYNMVGTPDGGDRFRRVYERLVPRPTPP